MNYNTSFGNGLTGTFAVLLVFLIKFLIVVLVIAFIVGLFMAAKNYIFNGQDIAAFRSTLKKEKKVCPACGRTLENDWKVCPNCGTELADSEINRKEVIA